MSKAFTKDDDDAGFEPPRSALGAIPPGPFRVTFTGAARLARATEPRIVEAMTRAEALARVVDPERAVLGTTVLTRNEAGEEKRHRLVSPEERALLGEGCSIEGPIGAALLGASVGDVCEVHLPRGDEELEIVAIEGERTTS